MKSYFLILFCAFPLWVAAQSHVNLEKLRKYYHSIDKSEFVDSLKRQYTENMIEIWESLDQPVDSMLRQEDNSYWEQMRSDSTILMLIPRIRNAENYSFKENIYDFLETDSVGAQILFFNKAKGIVHILRGDGQQVQSELTKKEKRRWLNLLEVIKREKPDVWFGGGNTFSRCFYYKRKYNLLYLKDNKIYVVRLKNGRVYELNRFVRKFYNEKEFKKRAYNDWAGSVWTRLCLKDYNEPEVQKKI